MQAYITSLAAIINCYAIIDCYIFCFENIKVTHVVNIKLAFMSCFFYNLVILIM